MEGLTWESLITAVVVLGALLTAYNLVMSAIKTHREEKAVKDKPIDEMRKDIEKAKEHLDNDNRRLNTLEKSVDETRDCMNILVRSQLAMLRHVQHGNNVEGLRESENEINKYLTER